MPMQLIRFWKPYNVLTKFTDAEGRPTLADYIKLPGVYAAGRLDMDSEGLLLLTDSGRISTRLTDPAFAHPRTYWAQVERVPDADALHRLEEGVQVQDYVTRPAKARLIDPPDIPAREVPIRYRANIPTAWLELMLTEGRNRQVRRMTAAVGYPTLRLVRWAVGEITLDGLQPGEWQPLSEQETAAILRLVKREG
jgi:23S rRNA pseudouridine2457 synthase